MAEKTITLTESEQELLVEILKVARLNGNLIEPKAFDPKGGDEYRAVCNLLHKVQY